MDFKKREVEKKLCVQLAIQLISSITHSIFYIPYIPRDQNIFVFYMTIYCKLTTWSWNKKLIIRHVPTRANLSRKESFDDVSRITLGTLILNSSNVIHFRQTRQVEKIQSIVLYDSSDVMLTLIASVGIT